MDHIFAFFTIYNPFFVELITKYLYNSFIQVPMCSFCLKPSL